MLIKENANPTYNETDYLGDIVLHDDSPEPKFRLMEGMTVGPGTEEQWHQLSDLHYKTQSTPAAPTYWSCENSDGSLVGVVVTNAVGLLLAARHRVFPKLRPSKETTYSNTARAHYLNRNFRRMSRIVTDTLYRGVGISYRMVNLVMRLEGIRYMEVSSSMSKFNPFDVKAGFQHGNLRHSLGYEKGLKFFRGYFESHPADHEKIMSEWCDYPENVQDCILKDMQEFYYTVSAKEKTGKNYLLGMSKIEAMPRKELLKQLQQIVFSTPVYGVWENPDLGRDLPNRLPLLCFDNQKPDEKLRLDLIDETFNN